EQAHVHAGDHLDERRAHGPAAADHLVADRRSVGQAVLAAGEEQDLVRAADEEELPKDRDDDRDRHDRTYGRGQHEHRRAQPQVDSHHGFRSSGADGTPTATTSATSPLTSTTTTSAPAGSSPPAVVARRSTVWPLICTRTLPR